MAKEDKIVVTPAVSAHELIARFLSVINEEARTNPRFRRALIKVLTNVYVPRKAERDVWSVGDLPW